MALIALKVRHLLSAVNQDIIALLKQNSLLSAQLDSTAQVALNTTTNARMAPTVQREQRFRFSVQEEPSDQEMRTTTTNQVAATSAEGASTPLRTPLANVLIAHLAMYV